MSKRHAYLIVYCGYITIVSIPILTMGYLFDCIEFMIISSIISNYLMSVTYTAHMKNNIQCIMLTLVLLTIFGYLSKTIPLEWSFLIGLIATKKIYREAPIKVCKKSRDLKWHKSRIKLVLYLCLLCSVICLYFELFIIAKCIMWSLILVAFMLFKNEK